ncbi:RrF2 family transcriptional regulator [Neobacillus fumarioli]|uniref:RrF2 family transcriptional regulator n=1 Tax=Neobacillus fumarioli TaxID=105229 RepID=UPI00082A08CC|nr:Rrf2 family transcriptional regulator [Neobacillus fumarioli]
MKVSSKGEYALRALLLLGSHEGTIMGIQEIADQTLVSIHYLEQILLQLKKLGYVTSKRGARGGYLLFKKPAEICIGEVIRDLEGPLSPMACASITKYEPCPLEAGCQLKPLWSLVRDTIAFVLERTTLEDLLQNRITKIEGEDFVAVKRSSGSADTGENR